MAREVAVAAATAAPVEAAAAATAAPVEAAAAATPARPTAVAREVAVAAATADLAATVAVDTTAAAAAPPARPKIRAGEILVTIVRDDKPIEYYLKKNVEDLMKKEFRDELDGKYNGTGLFTRDNRDSIFDMTDDDFWEAIWHKHSEESNQFKLFTVSQIMDATQVRFIKWADSNMNNGSISKTITGIQAKKAGGTGPDGWGGKIIGEKIYDAQLGQLRRSGHALHRGAQRGFNAQELSRFGARFKRKYKVMYTDPKIFPLVAVPRVMVVLPDYVLVLDKKGVVVITVMEIKPPFKP